MSLISAQTSPLGEEQSQTEIDENRALALEIRGRIEKCSEEEREKMLDALYQKWSGHAVGARKSNSIVESFRIALGNFNLEMNNFFLGKFERAYKLAVFEVTYLHLFFVRDKYSIEDIAYQEEEEDEHMKSIRMKFNKVFDSIINAEKFILSGFVFQNSITSESFQQNKNDMDLHKFTQIDYEGISSYQILLIYLKEQLHRKGYRRYKGDCYHRICTKDGHDTHTWKKAMDLKEFIYSTIKIEIVPEMWKHLTKSKDNVKAAVQYFQDYVGGEFEDLAKDRHVFSFTNGIYVAKRYNPEKDIYFDEWVPYIEHEKVSSGLVSCKYFRDKFEFLPDVYWFDIIKEKCKNLVSIMEYQQWPEEVQKWLCIMIGRAMYDLCEIEEWQVLAYLLGSGQSGKCERRDTPIRMFDESIKMIQDIRIGEMLMGDDGRPKMVLETSSGTGMLYKVSQSSGEDYYVTHNHVLSLRQLHTDNVYGIIDLSVEDYLKLPSEDRESLVGYKVFPFTNKDPEHSEITVTKHEIDDYFGFHLSGNQRYLHADYTVTHNSTILTKIVKQIYESNDVGVLSNNIEKKFGLSALNDKLLFIGPEIKGNLALEQTEFQSLISGEDIQIAEKHKSSRSVVWNVPGMLAGNEVPSYTDNSGSISRRLLIFKFNIKVEKGDTRLGKKLTKELPYIIQACNRAYQEAVNDNGELDIWNIVPSYFKETKEDMAANANSLVAFLRSETVNTGPQYYVREKLFIETFNEFCRRTNAKAPKWVTDYYGSIFHSYGLKVLVNKKMAYPIGSNMLHKGNFIKGVDVISEMESMEYKDV